MEILIFGGVALLVVGFIVFKMMTKKRKSDDNENSTRVEIPKETPKEEPEKEPEKETESDVWNEFVNKCEELGGTVVKDRDHSNVYNCKLNRRTKFAVIQDKNGNWTKR